MTMMNEPTPPLREESTRGSDHRQLQPCLSRTIELAEKIARQLLDAVRTTFPRLH